MKKLILLVIVWQILAVAWNFTALGKTRFLSKVPGGFLYSNGALFMAYGSRDSKNCGENPAGYDTLERWFGYSKTLKGVIFSREAARNWEGISQYPIRILHIDSIRKSVSLSDNLCLNNKIGSYYSWKLKDDRLYQIRGNGKRIKLLIVAIDSQIKIVSLPELPASVKVPMKEWESAAAIYGKKIAFAGPAGDIILIDTEKGSVVLLVRGDLRWSPPDWTPVKVDSPCIEWSPDGKKLAVSTEDLYMSLHLLLVDVNSRETQRIKIWGASAPLDLLPLPDRPEMITNFTWIPNSDYIACEVMPWESGSSYIFVVQSSTGKSYRLPFRVDRDMWSWIPNDDMGRHPQQKNLP